MKAIHAFDMFCGAGGTSTGLANACKALGRRLDLGALNHWPRAIETHSANHPEAQHLCASADAVDPRQAVPGGRLDLLVASPECLHFSTARGGRPMNDQSRASAWHVLRWAEALRIDRILIENVPEFATWGPLGTSGRPLRSRNGETFAAFLAALRSLGYAVEHRILNAADYGDATTRRRLFILARRGRGPIRWPVPTHGRPTGPRLFDGPAPWRAAREVIDWSLRGASIFGRKRPLAPTTLARIADGLRRFGGAAAAPFLVVLNAHNVPKSVDMPLPTVTGGNRFALCEPFMLGQQTGSVARPVKEPMPTIATDGAVALVEPFVVQAEHTGAHGKCVRSSGEPLPTITAHPRLGIVEPFLVRYNGTGAAESVAAPVPAITTRDRFGLAEPQAQVDILFRMLTPGELARAMGFPAAYHFAGNRGEAVKQIGNAVPVGIATALCRALLADA